MARGRDLTMGSVKFDAERQERKLSTRMKEHRTLVSKGNEKLALSTHNLRTGHTFDWDHVEEVDTEPRQDQRKVTEVMIHTRLEERKYQPKTRI